MGVSHSFSAFCWCQNLGAIFVIPLCSGQFLYQALVVKEMLLPTELLILLMFSISNFLQNTLNKPSLVHPWHVTHVVSRRELKSMAAVRPSYLYNGNPYTRKKQSLYRDAPWCTQNILPIHWNMYISYKGKNIRGLINYRPCKYFF